MNREPGLNREPPRAESLLGNAGCIFKIGEAAIHFICKVPCAEVLPVFAPHNFCAKFCPRILSVKSAMVDHGVDPFVAAAIVGSVGSLSAE